MKIISIRPVPLSEVPRRVVNTEVRIIAGEIADRLKAQPEGQAFAVSVDNLGKSQHVSVQKHLRLMGWSVRVSADTARNLLWIQKIAAPVRRK